MPRRYREFVDSRLRRSPPDRASAVPCGQAGENAMRFPHLAHRSAAAHKLHSTPQQHAMNLISGNRETSSRLPALSLFFPGGCPNNRHRRISLFPQCASQGASTASRRQRSPLPRPPLRPRLPPSELLRQAYPGSLRDRPFGPPARASDRSRLRALPWSCAVGRAVPQPYAPATIMPLESLGFSPAGAAIAWFSNSF